MSDEWVPGPHDRITVDQPGKRTVDEIVLTNVTVHIEQMSDRAWWGRFRAGDQSIDIWWNPKDGLRATEIVGAWAGVRIDDDVRPA